MSSTDSPPTISPPTPASARPPRFGRRTTGESTEGRIVRRPSGCEEFVTTGRAEGWQRFWGRSCEKQGVMNVGRDSGRWPGAIQHRAFTYYFGRDPWTWQGYVSYAYHIDETCPSQIGIS